MKKTAFDAGNSILSVIREQKAGITPVSGRALILQPNSIDAFGNSTESTARNPLSTSRDAKRGTITSLNSSVEMQQDFTISAFEEFMPAAICSDWLGIATNSLENVGIKVNEDNPKEATLTRPWSEIPDNVTIIASGFYHEENNGEKTVTANESGEFKVEGLRPESNGIGELNIEYPVIENAVIADGKIVYADAETIPVGSTLTLDGYVNEDNNDTVLVVDNTNGLLTVNKDLADEDTTQPITIKGKETVLYTGDMTDSVSVPLDLELDKTGKYAIEIDELVGTVSGTQTFRITVNGIDILNESVELPDTTFTANNLTYTVNRASTGGAEGIASVEFIGTNLSANGVTIKYKENDEESVYEATITPAVIINKNIKVTSTGYRYSAPQLPQGLLLYNRGYVTSNNNGVKRVLADDGKVITIDSDTDFVDEAGITSTRKKLVTPCGYQAEAGAFKIDNLGRLIADAPEGIFGEKGLNLMKGMGLWVGGDVTKDFNHCLDDMYANGFCRIKEVEDNILTLDLRDLPDETGEMKGREMAYAFTPDTDEVAETKEIRIFIGKFIRTWSKEEKDKYKVINQSYELCMVNDDGERFYEYSRGNLVNTLEIGLPSQAMATLTVNTIAQKVDDATQTPLSWDKQEPVLEAAMSTPNDVRCRVMNANESGLATLWTDATLAINNNVSSEYALGLLEAAYTALGTFEVTLSGTAFFNNHDVLKAITNNCPVSADTLLINDDGAVYIDLPSCGLSDGTRDFTNNEKVKESLTVTAYADGEFGFSISSTVFAYLPTEKADAC